jgi:hypothetical protein
MGYLECLPEHQRFHSRLQKASSAVQASFITYQQCSCLGDQALACARWRECCRDPCRASSMYRASLGCQIKGARSQINVVHSASRAEAGSNLEQGCMQRGRTGGAAWLCQRWYNTRGALHPWTNSTQAEGTAALMLLLPAHTSAA